MADTNGSSGGKNTAQTVKALRQTLDRFYEDMKEQFDKMEIGLGVVTSTPELHKKLKLLNEVYKKGGTITSAELGTLGKKLDYGKIGPFFRGKRASLAQVIAGGEQKIALTQYGEEQLKDAQLI